MNHQWLLKSVCWWLMMPWRRGLPLIRLGLPLIMVVGVWAAGVCAPGTWAAGVSVAADEPVPASAPAVPPVVAPVPVQIKVPRAPVEYAVAQDYFIGLARLALQEGANGRPVPPVVETVQMEQGRIIHELDRAALVDLYWVGTSSEREQKLRAVRIPLARGLLGFRRFIIRRDMAEQFARVSSLEDLRQYRACQGLGWPDSDILRAAGLQVTELAGYGNLFRALVGHRCDYFPRGYFETASEMALHQPQHPELMVFEPLVLHYPFALYFFVGAKNEALAQWLELGLERMIDSGKLLAYMHEHPYTRDVLPLTSGPDWRWIFLPNPILSPDTDYRNARYWFRPEDFVPAAVKP